jgi:Ner family transcriptional regulator
MDDSITVGQANSECPDWHPADMQAALKMRDLSLAGLSMANGYLATAAGKALKRPWPAMEVLIADAIGVPPHEIWPNRYKSRPTVAVPKIGRIKKI